MHHYGRNFGQSSTRPVPSRLQTQSFQQQRVNRYSSESPSPPTTPKPSSLRLPPGSSFNFFSVISKFEALDALNPPYKESKRGASPPHVHLTSATPRGRTHAGTQSKFAGIFSPRGESKEREPTNVEDHARHYTTPNQYAKPSYNKNYIPQRQSPDTSGLFYKSSGSRAHNGFPSETPGAINKKWASPELRKVEERKVNPSSIRNIISYFDGAIDAVTQNDRSQHLIEQPKTPLSQMQIMNKNAFPNTLSSKRYITPKQIHPDTPTKYSPLANQRKRNLVFGQTTPNPSVQSSSPPKSWTKVASPSMILKDDLVADQRGRAFERSLARSSKATHPPVSSRTRGGLIERNGFPSPRDQSPGKPSPSREYETLRGADQRDTITQVGSAPYQQQSLENKRGFSKEPVEYKPIGKQNSPKFERPQYETSSHLNKNPASHKQEPKSKVAMMKSLFERGSSFNDVPKVVDVSPPEPTAISISFRRPAPALLDFKSVSYNSVTSPKAVVPIAAKVSVSKTIFPFTSYTNDQSRVTRNRTFAEDEERNFNEPKDSMSTPPQQPNHALTRPPLQTTNNSTFRPSPQTTYPNTTQKSSVSARDTQDIYNELQKADKAMRAKKRKTFIEKWNFKLPGPSTLVVGIDGVEDFVSISSSSSTTSSGMDLIGEVMVVKEADCGLREPKPLRITEMKRMMMLCRGRAGILTAENKARHKL